MNEIEKEYAILISGLIMTVGLVAFVIMVVL